MFGFLSSADQKRIDFSANHIKSDFIIDDFTLFFDERERELPWPFKGCIELDIINN